MQPQSLLGLAEVLQGVSLQQVYAHDINGDGLADLIVGTAINGPPRFEVLLNINGLELGTPTELDVPGYDVKNSHVMFADMNGSGVDDLVVITNNYATYVDLLFGVRPGLLTTIQNGRDATTTLEYDSTIDLAQCSRGASGCAAGPKGGGAWTSETPQVMHPVTKIATTNNLGSVLAVDSITEYSYSDPVYDGRDRMFRGFRTVRQLNTSTPVDPSDPPVQTTTQFLVGRCAEDYPNGTCPQFPVDRPFGVLAGSPVAVDTYDLSGHHQSTVHTTYHVNSVAVGADGRTARFAYPGTVETYLYDSSLAASKTQTQTADSVVFDDGNGVVATDTFVTHVTHAIGIRGQAPNGTAILEVDKVEDSNGNLLDTMDWGHKGTDPPIHTTTTWYQPPGSVTAWIWRPQTQHMDPTTDPNVNDVARDMTAAFDAFGNMTDLYAVARGTGTLARKNPSGPYAQPPQSSTEGSTVLIRHVGYTDWGSPQLMYGAGGNRCSTIQYDAAFEQLPIEQQNFTGPQQGAACTGIAITTNTQYDRGFEQVTTEVEPSGAMSTYKYEAFGRLSQMFKPDPTTGAVSGSPARIVQYTDSATGPQMAYTQNWDGGRYRSSWSYTDGLGHTVLNLSEADMTAGDPAAWVATGWKLSAKGAVVGQYVPFFWGNGGASGSSYPLSKGFASSATSTQYDAFGHVLQQVDSSGTVIQSRQNHALTIDVWDAEELQGGQHPGAYLTRALDGHGRTTTLQKRTSTVGVVETDQAYTSGGNVASVTQLVGSNGIFQHDTRVVTRTVSYDSFGRMVDNLEPNTSLLGSQVVRGAEWRYVYDDNGDMVGTSDARGCGENIAYDGLGRFTSEDFSPCTAGQPGYSQPQGMDGTESYFMYDDTSAAPTGRLLESFDRGADTKYSYDFRDRITDVERRIAKAGDFGDPVLADRYAPHWYKRHVVYNDLDQLIDEGTGLDTDIPELAGIAGSSLVSTTYSARGLPSSVGGSYGLLLKSATYTADGLSLSRVYGDIASTTATTTYDADRRPYTMTLGRTAPASWTGQAGQIADLEDLVYKYDKMGHPTLIIDNVDPAPWPVGAKPRDVAMMAYDDYYRIVDFVADYNSGGRRTFPIKTTDTWTSPLQAEEAANNTVVMPVTGAGTRLAHQTFTYELVGQRDIVNGRSECVLRSVPGDDNESSRPRHRSEPARGRHLGRCKRWQPRGRVRFGGESHRSARRAPGAVQGAGRMQPTFHLCVGRSWAAGGSRALGLHVCSAANRP